MDYWKRDERAQLLLIWKRKKRFRKENWISSIDRRWNWTWKLVQRVKRTRKNSKHFRAMGIQASNSRLLQHPFPRVEKMMLPVLQVPITAGIFHRPQPAQVTIVIAFVCCRAVYTQDLIALRWKKKSRPAHTYRCWCGATNEK